MTGRFSNKKAFTLIELLVVIGILGILVLLAAPKLLGYTKDAKLTQVKNDVRVHEVAIEADRILDDTFIDGWTIAQNEDLESFKDSDSLFDKKGIVSELDINEEYLEIPSDLVNSKLKGDFYLAKGGNVFYHEEGFGGSTKISNYTVTFVDPDGNVISKEKVEKGGTVKAPIVPDELNGMYFDKWNKSLDNISKSETITAIYRGPTDVDLDMQDDFSWVKNDTAQDEYQGEKGYFQYNGTGQEVVEIPHVIKGVEITSYQSMFVMRGKDVKKVISTNENITNMSGMFTMSQPKSLDLSNFDTSNVENMSMMFWSSQVTSLNLKNWDTSKVTNMNMMFSNSIVDELDLSGWDTSSVTNMNQMFSASTVNLLGLKNWNTSKVETMYSMFSDNKSVSLDLSGWNMSNVTTMESMFSNATATSIVFGSNPNTSKVTNMRYMFNNTKVTSLDISGFDTSNVENMAGMFSKSNVNSLDLSNFNTKKVTRMEYMFDSTQISSLNISSFDTSKVTDMRNMFAFIKNLTTLDLSNFDTSNVAVIDMDRIFLSSTFKTVLAKTHYDVNKFNSAGSKPVGLTVRVK